MDIAKRAFAAGADACYIGTSYSARAYAKNFDDAELWQIIDHAHLRDKKIYVALNTMLFESELAPALAHAKKLYDMGADALILADLGLMRLVREQLPHFAVHASTQAAVQNKLGAALMAHLGVQRVIAPREASLADLKEMVKAKIEIEAFCHGALCSGISGMCLFSSAIGTRSGNRGRCAQPCRMAYDLLGEQAYHLSTKDLCTLAIVPQMIEAGLCSLKIEGRMKSEAYVVSAVAAYRAAIDAYYDGTAIDAARWQDLLARIYNRGGFTAGFIGGETEITYPKRPDHKGVYVGKIERLSAKKAFVQTDIQLQKGDGVEVGGDGYALTAVEATKDGYRMEVPQSTISGDMVYLRADSAAQEVALGFGVEDFVIPVDFVLQASEKDGAMLQGEAKGITATARVAGPLEVANKPVDETYIKKQLNKTGNTVFTVGKCDITITGKPFFSAAMLNKLRREVLEKLQTAMLNAKRQTLHSAVPSKIAGRWVADSMQKREEQLGVPYVAAQVWTAKQAKIAEAAGADRIYFAPQDDAQIELLKQIDIKKDIYLVLPPYVGEAECRDYAKAYKGAGCFAGLVASNISGVALAQHMGVPFVADYFCNVANSATYAALQALGAQQITMSTEINLQQFADVDGVRKEALVYGRYGIMTLRHCPVKAAGNCANCKDAQLTDRLGYSFQIQKNSIGGKSCMQRQVLQSVPLFIEDLQAVKKAGAEGIRLLFSGETDVQMQEITKAFCAAWKQDMPLDMVREKIKQDYGEVTRGHLYRGVE